MNNSPGPSTAGPRSVSAVQDGQSHAGTTTSQTQRPASRSLASSSAYEDTSQRSKHPCRFFATKKGCRAGDQCRYQHVLPSQGATSAESSNAPTKTTSSLAQDDRAPITTTLSPPASQSLVKQPINPRAVTKPTSRAETENPREFQLQQVARRHSPFRADLDDGTTTFKFRLIPTDPDFPFELETGLHCLLTVPAKYPQDGRPTLGVQNAEMPRGFQINVEKGFDQLVDRGPEKSLLALLNELDRNLERFLTEQKAATVKLVANQRKQLPEVAPKAEVSTDDPAPFIPAVYRYSSTELQQAKARRDVEVRQLEARLGRSEVFSKAADGVAFNVPLKRGNSSDVPASLRSLSETALIVPEVYPLEPCTIILRGVEGPEAENVEVAFEKHAVDMKELSLMAHINYLTQNLGKLAVDPNPARADTTASEEHNEVSASVSEARQTSDEQVSDPIRPHLRYIARPPEWDVQQGASSDDSTESDDTSEEEAEDELESIAGGAMLPVMGGSAIEKGVQLSFPGLLLTGIELLQISKLSLSIRCDRCKQEADIKGQIPTTSSASSIHRSEICQKCSATFTISYRPDLMHTTSSKAGYIDVENCSIVDLLPSNFQPTCSSCSTTFPSPPGITAVRGDTKLEVCRSCHQQMSFTVPDVRFLRVSTAVTSKALPPRPTKPKEKLGISAGTPLPANGKCQHYSKSYRWFRFSCCSRVFPCDKCHDNPALNPAQKDNPHPNEHADRMICGFCSREQRYHPETCRHCGHSVVKKSVTTGFWEGGKGTREKHLMRKKEGRKYKVSGREKKELNKKKVEAKGRGGMWWPE